MSRTVYEHQLPPLSDPEPRALADAWAGAALEAERPLRGLAYALPSALIGALIWGELNRATGFSMPWIVMAISTLVLGASVGLPALKLGMFFQRRWAFAMGAAGLLMALSGDLYAIVFLAAERAGSVDAVLSALGEGELMELVASRTPLDWVVSGLASVAAYFAARPTMDERQLLMQARINVAAARLEAAEVRDEPSDVGEPFQDDDGAARDLDEDEEGGDG